MQKKYWHKNFFGVRTKAEWCDFIEKRWSLKPGQGDAEFYAWIAQGQLTEYELVYTNFSGQVLKAL